MKSLVTKTVLICVFVPLVAGQKFYISVYLLCHVKTVFTRASRKDKLFFWKIVLASLLLFKAYFKLISFCVHFSSSRWSKPNPCF